MAENTLDEPNRMAPTEAAINVTGKAYSTTIAPKTFQVYIFNKAVAKK